MKWPGLAAIVVIASTFALVSCGGTADEDQPPEIDYGRDICDRCHMIISDARFAGGVEYSDGARAVFDDLGELVVSVQEQEQPPRRIWVHDYGSHDWIDGTEAVYVVAGEVLSPMGSGLVAFSDAAAAESFAAAHASTTLTFDDLVASFQFMR